MKTLLPLIIGLILFIGGHLVSRFAGVRAALVRYFGANVFRGVYSLFALMGVAMIAHGFGVYRAAGMVEIWSPPRFLTHIAMLLVWISFILLAATYLPGKIKAKAKHPMLAGIKLWALAHLLVNGDLGSMIMFTSFLSWAVFARISLKRAGVMPDSSVALAPTAQRNDILAVLIGTAGTLAFIYGLHKMLIGVAIIGV